MFANRMIPSEAVTTAGINPPHVFSVAILPNLLVMIIV